MPMNAFAKVDVETFFRFAAEHPEQRYELEKGVIVQQMTGGTRRHGLVTLQLCRLMQDQIDATKLTVVHERGVKVGTSARYPNIVIEPSSEPGDSLATAQPVLIVEVLSPSTTATDLNAKHGEYLSIPTLDAYIVASQSEPALLIWQRLTNGTFPSNPDQIEGLMQSVEITGRQFKVMLPLADIYKGVV